MVNAAAPAQAPFIPMSEPFVPPSEPERFEQIEPAPPAIDEGALRERELRVQEREAELDRRAPRVVNSANLTEKEVESQIIAEFAVNAFHAYADQPNITPEVERALKCTTLYVMVLRNGFPIIGSSVCAAPENYDVNEGRKEARAEAMAKLWLAEEYAHQNRLMGIDYVPSLAGIGQAGDGNQQDYDQDRHQGVGKPHVSTPGKF